MPDHVLIGPAGSDRPVAMESAGRRIGDGPSPDDSVIAVFPSHSWDAAVAIFNDARSRGVALVLGGKHDRSHVGGFWKFGGAPDYLLRAAQRLGVSTAAVNRAEAEPPIKAIATRLGQCYDHYRRVRGPNKEHREFTFVELRPIRAIVERCEFEHARLHAMAEAAHAMVEDCRAAFGLPPGEYRHRPGLGGSDEVDRLRAEHAELLGQNKQLAAMVEQLTAPAPAAQPEAEPAPIEDAPAESSPSKSPAPRTPSKGR